MKKFIDLLIQIYQIIVSPLLPQIIGVKTICRFDETCSSYSRRVIRQYGILYGLVLTGKRLIACQPFIHYG